MEDVQEELPDYDRDSQEADESKSAEASVRVEVEGEPLVEENEKVIAEVDEIMIPERVKQALEKSSTFEEFRQHRVFRFLHMYSGPKDVLAKEIETEASKARLRVECLSLDKKIDDGLDISTLEAHKMLVEEVKDGAWDATHAGFPCGSFSRARHRKMEGMPGPVRDGENIYGLATNNESQQEEADKGTMMAAQAAWIMEEQVENAKLRRVPPAATLENPPGDEKCGSAWQLPEIRIVMKNTNASVAQFNTCSFQTKAKVRWYKPGQFVGRLEGLDQLARVCRCPAWVTHEALTGKNKTEAAGEYPAELANVVAKNIVATWKRVLNLEYWRHQIKVKQEEVSSLQKSWVEDEEKRTEKLDKKRTIHMAVEKGERWTDKLPSSSVQPSKKQKKEEEDHMMLGGMRNPAVTVSRMHMVKLVGQKMRAMWIEFVREYIDAVDVATNYGMEEARFNQDIVEAWKSKLRELFRVKDLAKDGVVLRDNMAYRSPLDADLWDAWGKVSRDPDTNLPGFMRKGAPLGMELDIPTSNGIFPSTEANMSEEMEPLTEFETIQGLLNYKSVQEQPVEAKIEIERNIRKGFVKRLSWSDVEKDYGKGTCSKMALLLKEKPDGSTKRRIILDMKRSGGNSRAVVKERIILPRLNDVVVMVKNLKSREREFFDQMIASGLDREKASREVGEREFVLVDLADAFCHFAVAAEELCHCVTPDETSDGCLLWVAMLFGYKAAPLIMARLSAAIGRMVASFMMPYEGQLQIYVDDLIICLQGGELHRNVVLAGVLYTLAAMGVQVSLGKGERGVKVTWIGAEIELWHTVITLALPSKLKMEMLETLKDWASKSMISLKELRSVTGRLSWAAGVVPRIRWVVSVFYSVISSVEQDEKTGKETERAKSRDGDNRPKLGLVHTKRLGFALQWLIKILELNSVNLVRHEDYEDFEPTVGIITDASPKGVGGVLVNVKTGQLIMYDAFEAKFTQAEAEMLDVTWGEAESQSTVEAFAIFRALLKWQTTLKKRTVLVKSDSSVALHMLKKLASPSASLNFVAAEISLILESVKIPKLILHHIPGSLNVETDWLSRMHDRGPKPESLAKVPIRTLEPIRVEQFKLTPPGVQKAKGIGAMACQSGVLDNMF